MNQNTLLIPICKFFIIIFIPIKQGFLSSKICTKITMKEKNKKKKNPTAQISIPTFPTQDDIFVAQILLHLPNLILNPQSVSASVLKWGCTKRRSGFNDDVELRPQSKAAEESGAAAASPVTPLAFPPSQSDRKSSSHKRSREKYTAMIEELTQRRDLLKEEIGNVTKYYHKLIAYNFQLKAMKQEVLNSCQIKEEPKLEISRYGNVGVELRQHHHGIILGQPQPLVLDQMAEKIHHSVGPIPAQLGTSFNGLGPVGPFGIPDLNISVEESILSSSSQRELFADQRSRFAEARRRRMDIIKIKIMRSSSGGIKFPRTR